MSDTQKSIFYSCQNRNLRQPRECLLHFGGLLQGIIVIKTKLIEPRSAENFGFHKDSSVLFQYCLGGLLEGPSLPSSIVKEGSAWGGCECPEKRRKINQRKYVGFIQILSCMGLDCWQIRIRPYLGARVLTAGWSSLPAETRLRANDIPLAAELCNSNKIPYVLYQYQYMYACKQGR